MAEMIHSCIEETVRNIRMVMKVAIAGLEWDSSDSRNVRKRLCDNNRTFERMAVQVEFPGRILFDLVYSNAHQSDAFDLVDAEM